MPRIAWDGTTSGSQAGAYMWRSKFCRFRAHRRISMGGFRAYIDTLRRLANCTSKSYTSGPKPESELMSNGDCLLGRSLLEGGLAASYRISTAVALQPMSRA